MTEGISYYRVRENDHLYGILHKHYGNAEFLKDKANVMDAVKTSNPHIQNPDLIYPGQIIALPALGSEQVKMPTISARTVPESDRIVGSLKACDRETVDMMSLYDPAKVGKDALKSSGASFVGWVDRAASSAISDVRNIGLAYYQKEAGTITRNQYNYRRSVNVRNMDIKLKGLRGLITPGKATSEVMRVDPHAQIRLHRHIDEITRLKRIVKVAKGGWWF